MSDLKKNFKEEADSDEQGFFAEFWDFLKHNKKWWLTPIILVLLLVAAMILMSGSAAAPFIYTLF